MKSQIKEIIRKTGFEIRRAAPQNRINPGILAGVKKDYQILPVQELKNGDRAVFFGYHDKTPFSSDNSRILATSVKANDREASSEGSLMEIGYFQKSAKGTFDPSFVKLAETTTWCWQQGCMLQWHPLYPDRKIIFNRIVGGGYGSVVFDIQEEKVVRELNAPIYSLDPSGRYASSLNFARLGRLRPGYGYLNIKDGTIHDPAPVHDGVFLIDMENGSRELIVSLNKLAEYTDKSVEHYINHITFSPSGQRLAFFHIYPDKAGLRIVRFYTVDLKEKKLQLLEASRMVSHYCWKDDDQIFSTESGPEGCLYYLYDLEKKTKQEIYLPNIGDLHPMCHPVNREVIVADSKPDRKRDQYLFLFHLGLEKSLYISRFHTPAEFNKHVRCDLHPRWDRKGRYVVVDTAEGGKRSMVLIDVSESGFDS